MKNKISDKLKHRKHRCVKVVQSLVSGLLFFLCILVCGCERRQEAESGLTPLETDGLIASGAAEDGRNPAAESAAEDGENQTTEGAAGNGVRRDAGSDVQDVRNTQQEVVCFVHIYGAVVHP
ncbi:MAG: hypothetical protein ACI4SZ_04695, partial [Lachnospiraceae bacterium]